MYHYITRKRWEEIDWFKEKVASLFIYIYVISFPLKIKVLLFFRFRACYFSHGALLSAATIGNNSRPSHEKWREVLFPIHFFYIKHIQARTICSYILTDKCRGVSAPATTHRMNNLFILRFKWKRKNRDDKNAKLLFKNTKQHEEEKEKKKKSFIKTRGKFSQGAHHHRAHHFCSTRSLSYN